LTSDNEEEEPEIEEEEEEEEEEEKKKNKREISKDIVDDALRLGWDPREGFIQGLNKSRLGVALVAKMRADTISNQELSYLADKAAEWKALNDVTFEENAARREAEMEKMFQSYEQKAQGKDEDFELEHQKSAVKQMMDAGYKGNTDPKADPDELEEEQLLIEIYQEDPNQFSDEDFMDLYALMASEWAKFEKKQKKQAKKSKNEDAWYTTWLLTNAPSPEEILANLKKRALKKFPRQEKPSKQKEEKFNYAEWLKNSAPTGQELLQKIKQRVRQRRQKK
jgi:hypothetical protein